MSRLGAVSRHCGTSLFLLEKKNVFVRIMRVILIVTLA